MAEMNSADAVLSNIDLLIQILIRVPPKPLITFQIVSKHWLSIISDPHFLVAQTHHHLTTHPPSSVSVFRIKRISISTQIGVRSVRIFPKLSCLEDEGRGDPYRCQLRILSSCNGFFLYRYGYHNLPYILFNPTTQKHKVIPKPLSFLGFDPALRIVLAFDPLKSFHYKIVHFRFVHLPDHILYVNIFSSESGAWKEIRVVEPPEEIYSVDTRRIFWNGAIHWISIPNSHVSFIHDEEKFTSDRIPTNPHSFPEKGGFGYFGKSDTGLLLIKFSSEVADEVFTVLEMDKDNCWSPKHQVNLKPLVFKYPDMKLVLDHGIRSPRHSVLYVKSGTQNEDFSLILAIEKTIILYEVRKGSGDTDYKVLGGFPYHDISYTYHDMHPFIKCLAPVL